MTGGPSAGRPGAMTEQRDETHVEQHGDGDVNVTPDPQPDPQPDPAPEPEDDDQE